MFLKYAIALLALLISVTAQADYPYARETENPTGLDRYVAKPDPNYAWEVVKTEKEEGITNYTIDMTSQQWRTKDEVDRPIWTHWLTITVPDEVEYPTAMMFIDGGSNRKGGSPRNPDNEMKKLARTTKTVTASVFMIPNQPLVFSDAFGWGRGEDAMIAYTWDKFLRTGDEEWPARMPMTKAVVRAMDTVQEFCASEAGGGNTVEDFIVAGGSKRGWTTWTTAIVDTRVRAIVPLVIDLLNLIPSFHHHYASLAGWSAVIGDYSAMRVLDWLDTPENLALMKLVDPYEYRDRLTMPKLIMSAGNDQFFLPDSSQFYIHDLEGPTWMRYIPNTGHNINRDEAFASLTAFYYAEITQTPVPEYTFTLSDDAIEITVEPGPNGEYPTPTAARLWSAHNDKRRDFRGANAEYTESEIVSTEPGTFRVELTAPDTGWTAQFLEVEFPGQLEEAPYKFTSGVKVLPETYPGEYVVEDLDKQPKGFMSEK